MGWFVEIEYRDNWPDGYSFFTYDHDEVLIAIGTANNDKKVKVTSLEVKHYQEYDYAC